MKQLEKIFLYKKQNMRLFSINMSPLVNPLQSFGSYPFIHLFIGGHELSLTTGNAGGRLACGKAQFSTFSSWPCFAILVTVLAFCHLLGLSISPGRASSFLHLTVSLTCFQDCLWKLCSLIILMNDS